MNYERFEQKLAEYRLIDDDFMSVFFDGQNEIMEFILKIILQMRKNLASDLNLSWDNINIKAKTNEKLGYLGRNEAIEAQAIVLLNKKN